MSHYELRDVGGRSVGRARSRVAAHRASRRVIHLGTSVNRAGSEYVSAWDRIVAAWRGPHMSKGPTRSEAPPKSFKSPGGRTFTVGRREHGKRFEGDTMWVDRYPIIMNGKRAGKLIRDTSYGLTASGRPRWSASTREIVWSGGDMPPTGLGFDVSGKDTARDALTAWGRNVDEVLDWRAGKPVRSMYSKTGVFQRDANRAVPSVDDEPAEEKTYYAAMLDVTRHINKDALVKDTPFKASQIDEVYEVVIFTLDERVHLASLTPSTYYETVYFIIKGKDTLPEDEEEREKWHEMEDVLLQQSEPGSYMNYADAARIVGDKKRPKWMRAKNIGDFESMDDAREHAQGNGPF